MMNPIQKRLLRNWPPTNHVANSDMKWVSTCIPSFFVFQFSMCWLVHYYFQKILIAPASTSESRTRDTTNMLVGSDEVEWVSPFVFLILV
jgi:hypothetical protein